mmetsp:Transcript_52578/g.85204  ORF Transcript_52578/g.85204 Transcript_52578/m.85204 type:complete len:225 (-) Transcript_52578:675-1349(-)
MAERSENSSFAKTALANDGCSVKSLPMSPRRPASTTQSLCGHSVVPPDASRSFEMACNASSPKRSDDFSVSFMVSAPITSSTPPSEAFATFFSFVSTSPPPLQPAKRSFLESSTTWPEERTPSFSSMPPSNRATELAPAPELPPMKAKCRARAELSPVTELRLRCTSTKFRQCRIPSLTSFKPISQFNSCSRSKVSASGASDITRFRTSSSACSGGISSTSSIA